MYPVGFLVVSELPNHLVPHQVVFYEVEDICIRDASKHICVQVERLAHHVLRVLAAPNGLVELLASISRANGNGYTEVIADRLEYILCYSLEVFDLPVFGCVIDPKAAGRV